MLRYVVAVVGDRVLMCLCPVSFSCRMKRSS